MIIREKEIEQQLVKAAKLHGGVALKLSCPGFDGMPDRLVLLPMGRIGFVEVKAPGKKMRMLQKVRNEMLTSLGFKTYVLDNVKNIGEILDDIQRS